MQYLAPSLVLPRDQARSGKAKHAKVAGFREGWAWAPRAWTQVTDDTGVGDPRAATAEKGGRFLEAVSERLAAFLLDLSAADPHSMYE